ncbi:MAG: benzoate-CoA ligase family protein [Deltaproteobacteria bacterium]|nr:benzoate-CoA ligase family protein [Deltaproteobacteria bacterium]
MKVDLPDIYNAATTFVDENIAQGRAHKTAIYYLDRRFTYQEVFEWVNRTGNALRDLGVEVEQRVLLVLPDCPEFAFSFFGAIKIGAVPIPTNPWMKAKDYEYLLQDSRARVLIAHESTLPELEPIWNRARFLRSILVVGKPKGRAFSYESLVSKASSKLEAEPTSKDDVVMWNYTSGSTGTPKGAVHLQHDMITITELFVKPILGMREEDLCFSASKLFFSYGLGNSLYFPFRFGASTVLWPERPEPEKVLQVIERYRPTFFFSVPTLYARLLRVEKKYDLSSLRICLSSGEPLPPALFYQWKEKFGIELLDVVGSTEATHDFLANRPGRVKPGSSGEVTPAFEAKIVDEQGQEVPLGEVGNLLVKGDANSPYYWNKHEQTKKTMLGEWLKTGDTYYRDEEGYYWYCGRSDDMLKVGGMWVSPIEIENTLLEHPSVLEAAVTGHADQDGLTKPKAYVVLKGEYQPSEKLKEELQSLVKNRLAPYKYPRWIEFAQDLPKTVTGKIQRFKLRSNE